MRSLCQWTRHVSVITQTCWRQYTWHVRINTQTCQCQHTGHVNTHMTCQCTHVGTNTQMTCQRQHTCDMQCEYTNDMSVLTRTNDMPVHLWQHTKQTNIVIKLNSYWPWKLDLQQQCFTNKPVAAAQHTPCAMEFTSARIPSTPHWQKSTQMCFHSYRGRLWKINKK